MAEDVEPELTLAVDSMLPIPLLMESLKALRVAFPLLPASVYTEALGGAEQRLRDGAARLAIYTIAPTTPCDLVSEFMTRIAMWPVVAADHPLAALPQPLGARSARAACAARADRPHAAHPEPVGRNLSRHIWRFADLTTRLDFLLAGFGWCNMPSHMVAEHVAAGRLKRLTIANQEEVALPLSVVHERGRLPGRAGRWLIADLRERMKTCPAAHHPNQTSRGGRSRRRLKAFSRRAFGSAPRNHMTSASEAGRRARLSLRRSALPGSGSTSPSPSA